MNTNKTDFIWLGSKHQLAKITFRLFYIETVHVPVSSVVTCLGVQFDSQLTFIPPPPRSGPCTSLFLPSSAATVCEAVADNRLSKTLMHALIASRLDYCNSVLYQINTTATKTSSQFCTQLHDS